MKRREIERNKWWGPCDEESDRAKSLPNKVTSQLICNGGSIYQVQNVYEIPGWHPTYFRLCFVP